jgi:hypothetical protein
MKNKNNLLNTSSLPAPVRIDSIEIEGIDMEDYPDFCDAYADSAKFEDGTPLNSKQLEALPDSVIYNLALNEACGNI